MLNLKNNTFSLVFIGLIFLTNCTNNTHEASTAHNESINSELSEEFFPNSCNGCVTTNLIKK